MLQLLGDFAQIAPQWGLECTVHPSTILDMPLCTATYYRRTYKRKT